MPADLDGVPLIPGQFRDPFVWREAGVWFALIGAGLEGLGGTALLYRSKDGTRWEPLGSLLVGDEHAYPATGVMWELPVLLPVGVAADGRQRHALFIAPWWKGPNPHHLQHVWHWIGIWDAVSARFVPDHIEPREFDGGGHLTGPSGTVLEDGRAILWTITQDKRSGEEQVATGWAHNAGIPLELGLSAAGTLEVRPVAELAGLRDERVHHSQGVLRGRHLDIELVIQGDFEIDVFAHPDGLECTTLGVDAERAWVDRSCASLAGEYCEPVRAIPHHRSIQPTRARLVLDGSMIELWVDDTVMITSRSYSRPDSDHVRLRLPAGTHAVTFNAFRIHPAYRT
jgi:sucrose-6-phosphate hydrolase SacC (GH32 family)